MSITSNRFLGDTLGADTVDTAIWFPWFAKAENQNPKYPPVTLTKDQMVELE